MDITQKLEQFRELIEFQQHEHYLASYKNPEFAEIQAKRDSETRVKVGRKYANIDVGQSGKYMVELATGEIYGIKAYGVIHRGHHYGNLDTIYNWDWSGYVAIQRTMAQEAAIGFRQSA